MATLTKFWTVSRENAKNQPSTYSKQQPSLAAAKAEAGRLASKEGVTFFVFECVGAASPSTPPVVWSDAETATPVNDGPLLAGA